MEFRNNRIVTSVGYSFAFAALCGMALFPQPALADDDADGASSDAAEASAQSGARVNGAPVADEKSETVYIFANPDGSVKETEVSTTLKNPAGEGSLADSSVLTDIENAEGPNTYSGSGDGMVWDTEGKDVYYTGKTDKKAPVSIKVTYYLDGKETPYDKLAGASGKLKIRYDYDNNATVKAKIKGKEETLYVPFTFVTALMFDNDNFKNAEVTNGKLIDDGDRAIVAGYAIPGLQKSLGKMVDDFDIPDYFEVTADVTDFEMKTSLTIVTAGLMSDLNTDEIDTKELRDASGELSDAMSQILDGTGTLADGLGKLADGARSASKAAGKLADGADKVADGNKELAKGTGKLAKGAKQLANGTDTLASTIEKTDMVGGIEQLYKGSSALEGGLEQLTGSEKDMTGLYQAKNGADALAIGAGQLADGSQQVIDAIGGDGDTGTDTLNGALNTVKKLLASGKNEDLKKALETLKSVEETLSSLSSDAESAGEALQALSDSLDKIDMDAVTDELAQVITSAKTASNKLAQAQKVELKADYDPDTVIRAIDGITVKDLDDEQASSLEKAKEAAKEAVPDSEDISITGEDSIMELIGSAKEDVDAADKAAGSAAGVLANLDLSSTVAAIKSAAEQFQTAAEQLKADAAPLKNIDSDVLVDYETARTIVDGVQSSINQIRGNESEQSGMYKAKIGASQLQAGSAQLSSGLGGAISGLEKQLIPGMSELVKGLKALFESTPALVEGITQLNDGAKQLDEGTSTLDEGADKLAKGADDLADGANKFDDGLKALPEGADAAADGAGQLLDGLEEFNEEGIGKITDIIDDDLLPFVDRLDALKDAANDYNNFAGITKGTSGSVKFIIETDAISSEK